MVVIKMFVSRMLNAVGARFRLDLPMQVLMLGINCPNRLSAALRPSHGCRSWQAQQRCRQ